MAYANGRIPLTELEPLPWPEADHLRLREDAAASLDRVAWRFELAHGTPLLVTDAYRDYDAQVRVKAQKGVYAATPGTSNHGWGIAVDLGSGINSDTTQAHRWMEAVGPGHGWINPAWAVDYNPSNGQHEPWHWEYHPELDAHRNDRDDSLPLRVGSTGRRVAAVQRALGAKVDGLFGTGTDKVVRTFQAARGLTTDGLVGPLTFTALTTPEDEDDDMTQRIRTTNGSIYIVNVGTGLFTAPDAETSAVLGDLAGKGAARAVGDRERDVIRAACRRHLERLTGRPTVELPDGSVAVATVED